MAEIESQDKLATLISLGFDPAISQTALTASGDNLEEAMNWIVAYQNQEESATTNSAKQGRIPEELKMVMVVRTDLGMSPGKVAAQCVHAALGAYRNSMETGKEEFVELWEETGEAAICLQCKSETELNRLEAAAISAGLVAYVVQDAGRTEIESGSRTVLAIGPSPRSMIDKVTGRLRLY